MSKREKIEDLQDRVAELEAMVEFLDEQVDFLTEEPDEYIPESALVHEAYASRAVYPNAGDTAGFVAGYVARAKEEFGVYAP